MPRRDVFISYVRDSRTNKTFVFHSELEAACQHLSTNPPAILIDDKNGTVGKAAADWIQGLVKRSRSLVPLISDQWFEREWCRFELVEYLRGCAREGLEPNVIPVLVGDCATVTEARKSIPPGTRPAQPRDVDDRHGITRYIAALTAASFDRSSDSAIRLAARTVAPSVTEVEDGPNLELARRLIEEHRGNKPSVLLEPKRLDQELVDNLPAGSVVEITKGTCSGPLFINRGIGLWAKEDCDVKIVSTDRRPAIQLSDGAWIGSIELHSHAPDADAVVCAKEAGGIFGCTIICSKGVGLRVVQQNSGRIVGNHVKNSAFGIAIGDTANPRVEDNLIESTSKTALDVFSSAFPKLERNRIDRVFGVGLLVRDEARPEVRQIEIRRTDLGGVEVRDRAFAKVFDAEIHAAGQAGVWCESRCELRNVVIANCRLGAQISGSSRIDGEGVEFRQNTDAGIQRDNRTAHWDVGGTRFVEQSNENVLIETQAGGGSST